MTETFFRSFIIVLFALPGPALARPPTGEIAPVAHRAPHGTAHAAPTPAPAPVPAGSVDVRDAIARALDFTVTIEGDGVYGSGILITPAAGLILTAHHVVEEMKSPLVTFYDGRTAQAKVLEVDKTLDVALLQVPPQKGDPAPVGDATRLRPGEQVYAVGCPRRLGFTVSRGIVSFVGRYMDGARYVQTDLPINDGNSGGPVVNERGEVVGMMSFILRRAQGLSFALPVNYAAERFARAVTPPPGDASYLDRFRAWRNAAGPAASAQR